MTAPSPLKPGSRICECPTCGAYFGSVSAFDDHRYGPYTDRRCLTEYAMRERGFELTQRGYWLRPPRPKQRKAAA